MENNDQTVTPGLPRRRITGAAAHRLFHHERRILRERHLRPERQSRKIVHRLARNHGHWVLGQTQPIRDRRRLVQFQIDNSRDV